jgi:hypothetical protein
MDLSREAIRSALYSEWVEGGGSLARWQQLSSEVDLGMWDGYILPFPKDCITRVRFWVNAWWTVTTQTENLTRTVVMMRRHKSYDAAQRFAYYHTS